MLQKCVIDHITSHGSIHTNSRVGSLCHLYGKTVEHTSSKGSSKHHFKIPQCMMYCMSHCSMVCCFSDIISVKKYLGKGHFFLKVNESKCPLVCCLLFWNLHLVHGPVFCQDCLVSLLFHLNWTRGISTRRVKYLDVCWWSSSLSFWRSTWRYMSTTTDKPWQFNLRMVINNMPIFIPIFIGKLHLWNDLVWI